MKKTLFILLLTFSVGLVHAQKVKFKKGKVFVDGKECLAYDSSNPNNVELTSLDDEQTVILQFIRPESEPMYTKITFLEQKKSFTSRSYIFTKKNLVKKLISAKVLVDCQFNEDKIDKFVRRYDEDIHEAKKVIIEWKDWHEN